MQRCLLRNVLGVWGEQKGLEGTVWGVGARESGGTGGKEAGRDGVLAGETAAGNATKKFGFG
jgi:hypothetical protein